MGEQGGGQASGGWYDRDDVASSVNSALGISPQALGFGVAVPSPTTIVSDPRSLRALFLSGGGASGVYEAGVLQAMIINGLKFHALVGTSIGSINSAAYARFLTMRGPQLVNPAQADFLQAILHFWEYVDQSNITNLDSSPARDILSDLESLYLSLSSITRFWTSNLNPDLGHVKPPLPDSYSPNPLVRFRYQLRRAGAQALRLQDWAIAGALLLPGLLGNLLSLPLHLIQRAFSRSAPLGDLYTATAATIAQQIGARLGRKSPSSAPPKTGTAPASGIAELLHDIVDKALAAYNPGADAKAKRSLFGNTRIESVLENFPALRIYSKPGDGNSPIINLPAIPALSHAPLSSFRQSADVELRFTRSNMRNGNLEVSAAYALNDALNETGQYITTLLGLDNDPKLSITADRAASYGALLAFVAGLEAKVAFNALTGQPPVTTGKYMVGNPDLIHAVMASSAYPAAFPPVTIDQIYPTAGGDPDNIALRDICHLAATYRSTNPPQSPTQLDLLRAQYPPDATLNQAVANKVVGDIQGRASALYCFVEECFNFKLPPSIANPPLAIAQLAACIVATWYENYPIYDLEAQATDGGEPFVEQYNDGGATADAAPLANAINALEYRVARATNPADEREATHYVFFVHLGDAPIGVRDIGDDSELSPASGTLPITTMNRYLFYEYILRYGELGKRSRYLSDSHVANRIHGYIAALRKLGQAQNELLIKVVNIYPTIPLNSVYAFDPRLGYNHDTNRRQIATGCSDTMLTLWREVQTNDGSLTPDVVDRLKQWLVPGQTVPTPGSTDLPMPTLFCRNGSCMYRRECPFGDQAAPQDGNSTLITDYNIINPSDTSAPPAAGVLSREQGALPTLNRRFTNILLMLLALWPSLCYNTK